MNDTLLLLINGFAGQSDFLDALMVFLARDLVYIVFAVTLLCIGILMYKNERMPVVYFFVTLGVSFVLLQLMSLLNVDHRPFMDHHLTQLIPHAPGKSFPSDHTTVSTAIAAGILFLTRFKKTGAALLVCAALIGFARIFVGVHYPADIAGGLFTGLVGGAIVYAAKLLIARYGRRPIRFSDK
ncbi:MAG TPA: phosphatase PAP2 family protein [Candidatus Saccharimonadales bacterium]|nr:phosphatase PAP2 family protein [Candidatus Saccharimonadales bacterium]